MMAWSWKNIGWYHNSNWVSKQGSLYKPEWKVLHKMTMRIQSFAILTFVGWCSRWSVDATYMKNSWKKIIVFLFCILRNLATLISLLKIISFLRYLLFTTISKGLKSKRQENGWYSVAWNSFLCCSAFSASFFISSSIASSSESESLSLSLGTFLSSFFLKLESI